MPMLAKINGQTVEIDDTFDGGYLPMIRGEGEEYHVARDAEEAGEAAKEYWRDMAANDPEEFACLVGAETLIRWGMNQLAGPGTAQVRNLDEWLDVVADHPEEEFAGYDGEERDIEINYPLAMALGFDDETKGWYSIVAYRHN